MNSCLNYIIEANVGLVFFLIIYRLILASETDFRFKRMVLLSGIGASLILPLFHFNMVSAAIVPTLNDYIPSYWLPEVVVGSESPETTTPSFANLWTYITIVYGLGLVLFLVLFLIRLFQVIRLIRRSSVYQDEKFLIAESAEDLPTFSFFRFILIGRKEMISDEEKHQIIEHEKVHGNRLHSFDILLLNILQVFFWFNPLLSQYKKIFIQLHEFEADARAVENRNVNEYCSLLAKVALLSADFKLANHFNNSLTVKRINMMRTIKKKIRPWKVAVFFALLPVIFVAIACQDQIANDLNEIAKNSSGASFVPKNVQDRYDLLTKENPNAKYILLQLNDDAMVTLRKMEETYGLPKSMEIFKGDQASFKGASESGVVVEKGTGDNYFDGQSFAILEYTDDVKNFSHVTADGQVYTVVDQMPEFNGGFEALGSYLASNIEYPKKALQAGISGTVFTQFIVDTDGTITDVSVVKGLSDEIDSEAIRVVESMPAWLPGKQEGKLVRVRFVIPIKFAM
jgi:TonB family protein